MDLSIACGVKVDDAMCVIRKRTEKSTETVPVFSKRPDDGFASLRRSSVRRNGGKPFEIRRRQSGTFHIRRWRHSSVVLVDERA